MDDTDFIDKNGNKTHVEDGSNAVFKSNGKSQANEAFEFSGYNGAANGINLAGVIAGAQAYALMNYSNCNEAVNMVARTYESAVTETKKTLNNLDVFAGLATDIRKAAEGKLKSETISSAKVSAANGNLVLGASTRSGGSHVVTMSTKDFNITYNNKSFTYQGGKIVNVNGAYRDTNIGPGKRNSLQPDYYQKNLTWYSFPAK